jgi:hypothetical protein
MPDLSNPTTSNRIERLRRRDWSFGHGGEHIGIGTKDCPKKEHHHHDDFCELPTVEELEAAGIDPVAFKSRPRIN